MARVDHEIAMALGGWSRSNGAEQASDAYGNGFSVGALLEAISRLHFASVDLSHLRVCND